MRILIGRALSSIGVELHVERGRRVDRGQGLGRTLPGDSTHRRKWQATHKHWVAALHRRCPKLQLKRDQSLRGIACGWNLLGSCGGHTMSHPVFVLVFAGPLIGPAFLPAEAPASAGATTSRWTSVSLSTELRRKDTDRIDIITAGEEQQSSYGRCAAAADPELCRVLVSVVNVAAIIGSTVTGQ
jgi:hypothetical protein